MARRLVVDPITRIEGHLRIEVELDTRTRSGCLEQHHAVAGHRDDPPGPRPSRRGPHHAAFLRGVHLRALRGEHHGLRGRLRIKPPPTRG